jgi:hypothetical protein
MRKTGLGSSLGDRLEFVPGVARRIALVFPSRKTAQILAAKVPKKKRMAWDWAPREYQKNG